MRWFRRRRQHNALHGASQMVDSGVTSEVLSPHAPTCTCRRCKFQLSGFVRNRIDEHQDPDEYEALRELYDATHDQIALHYEGQTPTNYVPGEVRNVRALKELARQWRDHPDYRTEWERSK